MTQEKKQLSTTPAPAEPETIAEDEKDLYNGIIYSLFRECVEELSSRTEAEKAECNAVLDRFAEIEGVQRKSTYVMMYAGFYLGVGKGLDLVRRMES